jgi:hypothetical protein
VPVKFRERAISEHSRTSVDRFCDCSPARWRAGQLRGTARGRQQRMRCCDGSRLVFELAGTLVAVVGLALALFSGFFKAVLNYLFGVMVSRFAEDRYGFLENRDCSFELFCLLESQAEVG